MEQDLVHFQSDFYRVDPNDFKFRKCSFCFPISRPESPARKSYDDEMMVLEDMTAVTWLSLLGLLVIMIFFMKGLHRPFISLLSLLVGLSWTSSCTSLILSWFTRKSTQQFCTCTVRLGPRNSLVLQVGGRRTTLRFVFASAFKKDYIKAGIGLCTHCSLLCSGIELRRIFVALIALAPPIPGIVWTIGFMGLTGASLNPAKRHVYASGNEYWGRGCAVIIIQRWREDRTHPGRFPLSAGKGAILAALTTMIHFVPY